MDAQTPPSFDADDYRSVRALTAYIDRIGAEQLNFRRFMVKEHRGNYYTERAIIKLQPDGTIEAPEEYAPTEAEADAIRIALRDIKWPQAIGAGGIDELRRKSGAGPDRLFAFWNVSRTEIIMVQERVEFEDGGKAYLPWTYFSDGHWRRMEPSGNLPFWKPALGSQRNKIMVHEGAKAARHIDALVNDPARAEERKKHPWGEELSHYEHWGMIGGALAPHRADYGELRTAKPHEVVYICDNDTAGRAVLKEFSRHYHGALRGVMFDPSWPESWDMADAIPATMYNAEGRYNGPSLKSMFQNATHATRRVIVEGRAFYELNPAFRDEWFHSVRPHVYIELNHPNVGWTDDEFNNRVRPFSDVKDTAEIVRCDAASKGGFIKYDPSRKPGIYEDEGDKVRYINTHCPSSIRAEEGDASPWVEFLEHLIPDEKERTEVIRWCATLIVRPELKMTYGLLLISEVQGVGKTTLGEKILSPLIGDDNTSYPSEKDIVDSGFNYWASHKRLVIVNEIYAGQSKKAYNNLKSIITDRKITVNRKFQAAYEIQNWVHIIACSNSPRALLLSDDDRRWFVPSVTNEKNVWGWWSKLNKWLAEEGGLGKVKWWLEHWLKDHEPVQPGATAPWSIAKQGVIEEGRSPGLKLVAEALDAAKHDDEEAVKNGAKPTDLMFLDVDLVDFIRNRLYEGRLNDRLEKPSTIRKLAKAKGWWIGEERARHKDWGTRNRDARMICSSPSMAKVPVAKHVADGVKPLKPEDVF